MDEYIKREAVLKIIADNCPHDKGGYNTEEEMGAGAACYYIRKDVDNLPTADVVPKSEYERLEKLFNDMTQEAKGYLNRIYGIRANVAGEIFAEIENALALMGICLNDETILWKLKKKYTEEQT